MRRGVEAELARRAFAEAGDQAVSELDQGRAHLEWVDWFNNRRLFEALGNIPPAAFEHAHYASRRAA